MSQKMIEVFIVIGNMVMIK